MQRADEPEKHVRQFSGRFICLLLVLFTLALYWPVRNFEFNNYDDAQYLTENPRVQNGLTSASVVWAFTTGYGGNWHPVTWLSHMLDFQLYGFNAGGHHFTSVLFHAANAALLFLLLRRWTGATWRPAFVAALFAWHPLHVESVAWVAERKDVLSAFFGLLALFAYCNHANASREPSPEHSRTARLQYILALIWFALGLLCKPMLVSLPLLLLLLDYWPLRRFQFPTPATRSVRLLVEKIPFCVLAVASGVVTFFAQKQSEAVQSLENLPLAERFENVPVAYAKYLGKLFWPAGLALPYPYAHHLPADQILAAVLLLAGIFAAVFLLAGKIPQVLVGWLWFFISLIPVIGIVQVGNQALADRYTYLPSIGIFIMLAWGVPAILENTIPDRARSAAIVFGWAGMAALLACVCLAAQQVQYWRNSVTLFSRAVDVTTNNAIAECNLGEAFAVLGRTNEALLHERRALEFSPHYAQAENNLGTLLGGDGDTNAGVFYLLAAEKDKPKFAQAFLNLGALYYKVGRIEDAITQYHEAIGDNPDSDQAHANLGIVLASLGRTNESIAEYHRALAIAPGNAYAHNALGLALEGANLPGEAAAEYASAIAAKPEFAAARENLGVALTLQGNFEAAEIQIREALKLQPDSPAAHFYLGNVLLRRNQLAAAAGQYEEAIRLRPGYPEARFNLGLVQEQIRQGQGK